MAISQSRSRRAATGKRLKDYRKKKQHETGSRPFLPKIGKTKAKVTRVLGGNSKVKLLNSETINVIDPKTKKAMVAKLVTVIDNPANRNFIRRNILTRGTVVDTDKGKARITNRPGQEGTVNGILI
ncbi:30S ribosomal protein S8e [Candidatus Woesearchaeota archaeon]|nr:30S ribosomal protein S8e [Candidatus Woesearchaeota archaeon]